MKNVLTKYGKFYFLSFLLPKSNFAKKDDMTLVARKVCKRLKLPNFINVLKSKVCTVLLILKFLYALYLFFLHETLKKSQNAISGPSILGINEKYC